MPAGVNWSSYLKFLTASLLSMMAGAQLVHVYYKPDLTIPETPPERGELGQLQKEAPEKQNGESRTQQDSS